MGIENIVSEDFGIISLRLLLAAILSGCVGLEREVRDQPAGLRTHLLVGIGACMMMLVSLYGFTQYLDAHEGAQIDFARIPSYVISGIGFLGAGVILTKGKNVFGLTTAASIWVVACLGLVVGVGMYDLAILATAVVLICLHVLRKLTKEVKAEIMEVKKK